MLQNLEQRNWETPIYADFPRSEYDNRISRIRHHMQEEKIDLLVIWDEKNARYFTGFHNNLYHAGSFQPAVILIPIDKEPVIIVPDFFCGVAEGYTYLNDIRLMVNPHVTANIRKYSGYGCRYHKGTGLRKGKDWSGSRITRRHDDSTSIE